MGFRREEMDIDGLSLVPHLDGSLCEGEMGMEVIKEEDYGKDEEEGSLDKECKKRHSKRDDKGIFALFWKVVFWDF